MALSNNDGIQKIRKEYKWEGKHLSDKTSRKAHKQKRQNRQNRRNFDD